MNVFGLCESQQLYRYTRHNPINYVDLTGHRPVGANEEEFWSGHTIYLYGIVGLGTQSTNALNNFIYWTGYYVER